MEQTDEQVAFVLTPLQFVQHEDPKAADGRHGSRHSCCESGDTSEEGAGSDRRHGRMSLDLSTIAARGTVCADSVWLKRGRQISKLECQ